MGFFNSYRIKRAIASLVMIVSILSTSIAKAEWSSETKKSYNRVEEALKKETQDSSLKNKRELVLAVRNMTGQLLKELKIDFSKGIYMRKQLEMAKSYIQSLKSIGEDVTNFEITVKALEQELNRKEAEELAKVKVNLKIERKNVSPPCKDDPDWVKNWRKGDYLWKDGNTIYVVGYAKYSTESGARDGAFQGGMEVYQHSLGKVEKLTLTGEKITTVITTNL